MRWIRTNRRAGGVLALFALFFQLAIAATHVHANGHASALIAASNLASVSLAGGSDAPGSSDHRSHGPLGGAPCDLCVLLHAAALGDVTTPPPALATPFDAPTLHRPALTADRSAGVVRHFLPQSRAPPAA